MNDTVSNMDYMEFEILVDARLCVIFIRYPEKQAF